MEMLIPFHAWALGAGEGLPQQAAAVAARLGASLHLLALLPRFPASIDGLAATALGVDAMAAEVVARSRDRADAFAGALADAAREAGAGLRRSEVECFPASAGRIAAEEGRYHDLILVGIGAGDAAEAAGTAESCLFGAGRPVMAVPDAGPAPAFEHVLVAWDGGRAAARAVADARPFLERAGRVTVATVGGDKAIEPGAADRLAASLARRGIAAAIARPERGEGDVAGALYAAAEACGAGLVVMGGFGHSRLRDFVLGGATAAALKAPRMATLLAH